MSEKFQVTNIVVQDAQLYALKKANIERMRNRTDYDSVPLAYHGDSTENNDFFT